MGQPEAGAAGGMMVPDDAQGLENAVHEANAIGTSTLHNILANFGDISSDEGYGHGHGRVSPLLT